MSTTSIPTFKMAMVTNFSVFLCPFFSLIGVISVPKFFTTYKTMGSISFFIFIRHFYFFSLLDFLMSSLISLRFLHNTLTASSPLYKNSWLVLSTAFTKFQHTSARFMFLIILIPSPSGFLSSSVKHSKSAYTTKGHLNFLKWWHQYGIQHLFFKVFYVLFPHSHHQLQTYWLKHSDWVLQIYQYHY